MNESHERPDFDRFEISSIAHRKQLSNAFLALCIVTSALSIIILVVLIATIVVSALPVFGPHADTLESESRVTLVQGINEGNDPETVDIGDLVQGIFRATRQVYGGLGDSNDQRFTEGRNSEVFTETKLGVFSLEVAAGGEGNSRRLIPATGEQSIGRLVEHMGFEQNPDLRNAALVVFSSDNPDFAFDDIQIDGSLIGDELMEQLRTIDDWSLNLAAGMESDSDFAEIRFLESNKGIVDAIRKTRVRKRAGHLKLLTSVLYERDQNDSRYQPVGLRPYSTNDIVRGHLKVDGAELTGVSRRKKKGFDLGGRFELQWCATPEEDASFGKHLKHFLIEKPGSSDPSEAGIGPALWGSIWVCVCCALFALPLGIGTALFLEEFKPTNRVLRLLQNLIQLNIANLAGVPSIVYGILGLTAFATMFGVFGSDRAPDFQVGAKYYYQYLTEGMNPVLVPVETADSIPELVAGMDALDGNDQPISLNVIGSTGSLPDDPDILKWTLRNDAVGGLVSDKRWYYFQLPFGRGVLAASLTLMLVILPVIIIASQESIKAVPSSLRQGAMGLGATRWQVVRNVTLPAAIPGMMTGAILSVSRAIGEAAPIVVLCGTVFIASSPQHLMDFYSVLPIQIFYLTGQPVSEEGLVNFQNVAAAASLVLLVVLLSFNTLAIALRQLTQKPLS